jgi:lipase
MAVLHTHRFGDADGEPVLALHGITAHGRRFRRLAEEGLPHRRTLAVDLRGHGRSTSDGPWSVAQHVGDVIATLDHHGVGADRGVDVVGHSYGGVIALNLLATAPARVRSLVLLDPALALAFDPARGTTAAVEAWPQPSWATVEEATIARRGDLPDSAAAAVAEEVAEHLVCGADGRYRMRYTVPAVVAGWGEMCAPLPELTTVVPTLLVVADRADFVPPTAVEALRAHLGDALRVEHVDAGHLLYWERFEETATLVAGHWS